ncbi:alpha-1,2-fucosyltransferase [Hallella sp.]|uniref:alpha-1,2-fucosyltransferase n=1 Tax=Hallella sp. TaxID=2980186 RepID=UPI0030810577
MKIVQIIGGLGNQMFQYSLALALRRRYGNEVAVDTCFFRGYPLHNHYEIDKIFHATLPVASKREVRNAFRLLVGHYNLSRIYKHCLPCKKTEYREKQATAFNPNVLEDQRATYYDGYWQDHRYLIDVKDDILREFVWRQPLTGKNAELFQQLASGNSVSIHYRGGDYVNHPTFGGICDVDYYKRAIAQIAPCMRPGTLVAIFSNDIATCKEHLCPLLKDCQVVFVDWNQGADSHLDMRLMTACQTNIVANSSFSWWGAFLNQRKDHVVVAPKRWTRNGQTAQRCLPDWLRV